MPFELRHRLCELAVADLPGFRVSALEAERPGPSYTSDTLAALSRERPDDTLYFLLGVGDLLNLEYWKDGFSLGRLANLAVHSREGQGLDAVSAYLEAHGEAMGAAPAGRPGGWDLPAGHHLHYIDVSRLDISATDVRERWRLGKRLDFLLPEAVLRELSNHKDALTASWGR